MEKAYRYTGYFMLLLIPLVILGFYPTYFSLFPDFGQSITLLHHLHAAIAVVWILMLIVQPFLIHFQKYQLHKTTGRLSYIIFPLLVLSFIPLINNRLHSDQAVFAFLPIADLCLLIPFYTLAIYYRKKTSYHMRFMIGTALVFLGPTFGRIAGILLELPQKTGQNTQYVIAYSIVLGLILLDRKHGRDYKPYIIIAIGFVLHQVAFNILF